MSSSSTRLVLEVLAEIGYVITIGGDEEGYTVLTAVHGTNGEMYQVRGETLSVVVGELLVRIGESEAERLQAWLADNGE